MNTLCEHTLKKSYMHIQLTHGRCIVFDLEALCQRHNSRVKQVQFSALVFIWDCLVVEDDLSYDTY